MNCGPKVFLLSIIFLAASWSYSQIGVKATPDIWDILVYGEHAEEKQHRTSISRRTYESFRRPKIWIGENAGAHNWIRNPVLRGSDNNRKNGGDEDDKLYAELRTLTSNMPWYSPFEKSKLIDHMKNNMSEFWGGSGEDFAPVKFDNGYEIYSDGTRIPTQEEWYNWHRAPHNEITKAYYDEILENNELLVIGGTGDSYTSASQVMGDRQVPFTGHYHPEQEALTHHYTAGRWWGRFMTYDGGPGFVFNSKSHVDEDSKTGTRDGQFIETDPEYSAFNTPIPLRATILKNVHPWCPFGFKGFTMTQYNGHIYLDGGICQDEDLSLEAYNFPNTLCQELSNIYNDTIPFYTFCMNENAPQRRYNEQWYVDWIRPKLHYGAELDDTVSGISRKTMSAIVNKLRRLGRSNGFDYYHHQPNTFRLDRYGFKFMTASEFHHSFAGATVFNGALWICGGGQYMQMKIQGSYMSQLMEELGIIEEEDHTQTGMNYYLKRYLVEGMQGCEYYIDQHAKWYTTGEKTFKSYPKMNMWDASRIGMPQSMVDTHNNLFTDWMNFVSGMFKYKNRLQPWKSGRESRIKPVTLSTVHGVWIISGFDMRRQQFALNSQYEWTPQLFNAVREIDIWVIKDNMWHHGPDLPLTMNGAAGISTDDGTLVLFGGIQDAFGSRSGENGDRVFMLETRGAEIGQITVGTGGAKSGEWIGKPLEWVEISRMPYSRSFSEVVRLSDTKYLLYGGMCGNDGVIDRYMGVEGKMWAYSTLYIPATCATTCRIPNKKDLRFHPKITEFVGDPEKEGYKTDIYAPFESTYRDFDDPTEPRDDDVRYSNIVGYQDELRLQEPEHEGVEYPSKVVKGGTKEVRQKSQNNFQKYNYYFCGENPMFSKSGLERMMSKPNTYYHYQFPIFDPSSVPELQMKYDSIFGRAIGRWYFSANTAYSYHNWQRWEDFMNPRVNMANQKLRYGQTLTEMEGDHYRGRQDNLDVEAEKISEGIVVDLRNLVDTKLVDCPQNPDSQCAPPANLTGCCLQRDENGEIELDYYAMRLGYRRTFFGISVLGTSKYSDSEQLEEMDSFITENDPDFNPSGFFNIIYGKITDYFSSWGFLKFFM